MVGYPAGNVKLGRRFTPSERRNPACIQQVGLMQGCANVDHMFLARFGGECDDCGRVWELMDLRSSGVNTEP